MYWPAINNFSHMIGNGHSDDRTQKLSIVGLQWRTLEQDHCSLTVKWSLSVGLLAPLRSWKQKSVLFLPLKTVDKLQTELSKIDTKVLCFRMLDAWCFNTNCKLYKIIHSISHDFMTYRCSIANALIHHSKCVICVLKYRKIYQWYV